MQMFVLSGVKSFSLVSFTVPSIISIFTPLPFDFDWNVRVLQAHN